MKKYQLVKFIDDINSPAFYVAVSELTPEYRIPLKPSLHPLMTSEVSSKVPTSTCKVYILGWCGGQYCKIKERAYLFDRYEISC